MTGSILMLIAVLAPAQGEPSRPPGSAERPKPAPITVEAGLAAIETLRSDGLRAFNHYATEGRNTTTERIAAKRIEGPLKYEERLYRRAHDEYDKALRRLASTLEKVVPTEPIAPDARRHFGDASLSENAIRLRRQAWILERLKEFDPASDAAQSAIVTHARRLTSGKRAHFGDADYGRGWIRGRGGTPCGREREAADLRARLRAEFERRLSQYWDEAREAWIAAGSGK